MKHALQMNEHWRRRRRQRIFTQSVQKAFLYGLSTINLNLNGIILTCLQFIWLMHNIVYLLTCDNYITCSLVSVHPHSTQHYCLLV